MKDISSFYFSRPWVKNYVEDVPRDIDVPSVSIPKFMEENMLKYSNNTAIFFYGAKIKYGELLDIIKRFASALKALGVSKGDGVAIYLPNCPQFAIVFHASLMVGARITAISPLYGAEEIKFILSDSESKTLIMLDIFYDNVKHITDELNIKNIIVTNIADYMPAIKRVLGKIFKKIPSAKVPKEVNRFLDLINKYDPIDEYADIDPRNDLAALLYTGGTTGPPKGVMLTHYNLIANALQMWYWIKPIAKEGQERVIALLPFFHVYGQVCYLIEALCKGFTLYILPRLDIKELLALIDKHDATIFIGVPYLYNILASYKDIKKYDLSSLKICICAADTLHKEIVDRWKKAVGDVEIYEGYGLTEMSPATIINPIGGLNKVGSMGIPISSIDAIVIDPDSREPLPTDEVGELVVKGPNMMKGYWKRPEENKNVFIKINGQIWLRTGDMVKMDKDGYFYFIQRAKDMIKYKGYSIFPIEIEEVLYKHPAIKEVAVVGIPDQRVGENICAVIVLKDEYKDKIDKEDIVNYCKDKLASYKIPKMIYFEDSLPKSPVGKILKRELRSKIEETIKQNK